MNCSLLPRGFKTNILLQRNLSPKLFQKNMSDGKKQGHCVSYPDVKDAWKRIEGRVHYTPIFTSTYLDKLAGRRLFFKAENQQKTGSFKIRGAINAVAQLCENREKLEGNFCVVTHSSGNHGQALAKAAQLYNVPAFIAVPSDAPQCKVDAIKGYGGTVVPCIPTLQGRIDKCDELVKEHSGIIVHPNQTPAVIAGQGTIAMEMLQQNPDLDAIIAPVGGGGMISGIAIAAKEIKPSIKVYAAEPVNANDCYLSKQNGKLTHLKFTPKTIADAVKADIGSNTWPIIRDMVDDVITVEEEEILQAMKLVWERCKLVIEPTSGVGVAAVISQKFAMAKNFDESVKNVGIVLCGGNIDLSVISKLF